MQRAAGLKITAADGEGCSGHAVALTVSVLARFASPWRRLILPVLPLAAVGLVLALNGPSLGRVHPNQSKAAIIDAALHGYDATAFSRVEAKLMYRRDLQRAAKELSGTSPDESPDDLIWVVAVSGNYGISPSFGCCSVPADYHGHNTWGLAIFVDAPSAPQANEFGVSYHGDWPPFFDSLPDLAAG